MTATPIRLRHGLPHTALGLLSGVDRSTVPPSTGEMRGPEP
ncbi:hypothetical protein ACFWGM_32480 [Streptomyces roseolus]